MQNVTSYQRTRKSMNIYMDVEVCVRELDSKVLLAVLAAVRGHTSLVGDLDAIHRGIRNRYLPSGIFHAKSLTPKKKKIKDHEMFRKHGMRITSLDEEGGFIHEAYNPFLGKRFGANTVANADAIFCWGNRELTALAKAFPSQTDKFFLTGGPRTDFWLARFQTYWCQQAKTNKTKTKPFFLVSGNTSGERQHAGTLPESTISDDLKMSDAFVDALDYLGRNAEGYDLVYRPHPAAAPATWSHLLAGIPNVKVVAEGPIEQWIASSLGVLHNSCTSAVSATLLGKPVVTYIPFEMTGYAGYADLPNMVGTRAENVQDLKAAIDAIFEGRGNQGADKGDTESELRHRLFWTDEELAANRMIDVWEEIGTDLPERRPNFGKVRRMIQRDQAFESLMRRVPRLGSKYRVSKLAHHKFPVLNQRDVLQKVRDLSAVVGIKRELNVHFASERAFFVSPK